VLFRSVLKTGLLSAILIGSFSCKNNNNEVAETRIAALESYVDSLKTVSSAEVESNWEQITADYNRKTNDANVALSTADEATKAASQGRVDASIAKYDEFKVNYQNNAISTDPVIQTTNNPSQSLRDRLFGAGKIGNDMSFDWVNKNNIVDVYDKFFESYKENRSDFSREDYDEIKLMFEALDNRKNTIEKEGLSSSDNMKIASIKVKFNPMFQLNRVGAKARETAEAKE
jgi:hypothetical protein